MGILFGKRKAVLIKPAFFYSRYTNLKRYLSQKKTENGRTNSGICGTAQSFFT
jgi:hypothetical protein